MIRIGASEAAGGAVTIAKVTVVPSTAEYTVVDRVYLFVCVGRLLSMEM